MNWLIDLLDALNTLVCGPILPALLIGCGVFLSFQTNFLQLRKFGFMIKNTVLGIFQNQNSKNSKEGISSLQAVCTALAGTIGVGSIAGVATAIHHGGPGALFWMWVSAFFGMVIKYSEILLSILYQKKEKGGTFIGGPMYYMKSGLGQKILPILFSLFGIFTSFGIGNLAQSNAISLALETSFSIPKTISSFFLMILAAVVILGGVKRIASVNEMLVPIMAIFYILCSVFVVTIHQKSFFQMMSLVLKNAFSMRSAASGIGGWSILSAIRFGFSRGIFSNEAGLGSAPIAHAASRSKEPVKQALWGMFEVFFTTVFICTLTGFVILSSDSWMASGYKGIGVCVKIFNEAIPSFGGIFVAIATVFFALSSILGWAYYGEAFIGFLFRGSKLSVFLFRVFFIVLIFFGGIIQMDTIWKFSETMNALMAIPNLISLFALHRVVKKETNEYFSRINLAKSRNQ